MKIINSSIKLLIVIILPGLLLSFFGKFCLANGVSIGIGYHPLGYVALYFINILIEFIMFFLLSELDLLKSKILLFFSFAFANLITYPIVQTSLIGFLISILDITIEQSSHTGLPYTISTSFTIISLIIILEIIIVIIEYVFISIFFILFLSKSEKKAFSKKGTIFFNVLIANITSFGLGTLISGSFPFF
jgi:hypothetical protein